MRVPQIDFEDAVAASGADFSHSLMEATGFSADVDFNAVAMPTADFTAASLFTEGGDSRISFSKDADLTGTVFSKASLNTKGFYSDIDFAGSRMPGASFSEASLIANGTVNFYNWEKPSPILDGNPESVPVNAAGADFSKAFLKANGGIDFDGADLAGANFSKASLTTTGEDDTARAPSLCIPSNTACSLTPSLPADLLDQGKPEPYELRGGLDHDAGRLGGYLVELRRLEQRQLQKGARETFALCAPDALSA